MVDQLRIESERAPYCHTVDGGRVRPRPGAREPAEYENVDASVSDTVVRWVGVEWINFKSVINELGRRLSRVSWLM